ncbi:MAG TPA: hypothetical protein VF066_04685, partial [Thermoleophilaceae bacterium]
VRTGSDFQDNAFNQNESNRPADVPSNVDPQTYVDPKGDHYQVLHGEAYSPAVDAQGNADCQVGQYGYMDGPLNGPDAKYPPAALDNPKDPKAYNEWEKTKGGASHTSTLMDHPGLAGPTFVGEKLGIRSLKDVK